MASRWRTSGFIFSDYQEYSLQQGHLPDKNLPDKALGVSHQLRLLPHPDTEQSIPTRPNPALAWAAE